jgi:hypothetical protein
MQKEKFNQKRKKTRERGTGGAHIAYIYSM